jgi:hypothetical protein
LYVESARTLSQLAPQINPTGRNGTWTTDPRHRLGLLQQREQVHPARAPIAVREHEVAGLPFRQPFKKARDRDDGQDLWCWPGMSGKLWNRKRA